MSSKLKRWLTPAILMIAVLAVYRQVIGHSFTYFDDNAYVFQNPIVLQGLTWSSVQWAFTTFESANYHPLTWLSHMLDVEVYGLWAGGHAFTNLLWHSANVFLVWRLARMISGQDAVGFCVAILFAVHPLNVESVASISQRKTVVSACFGLLSLLAYLRYAKYGGAGRYLLSLGAAALSLLAKPLFVTLPALLLLLDYWPLARFPNQLTERSASDLGNALNHGLVKKWLPLILEKLPFMLLAGAISVATFYAQRAGGAMNTAKVDGVTSLAGAVFSYFFYLQKLFWPSGLAPFYPIPPSYSLTFLLVITFVLFGCSIACWSIRRSKPYAFFGWLWFVGTLVPMAGFVRVGGMGMADRYAYIPQLGIFIAIATLATEWSFSLSLQRYRIRTILMAGGICSLVSLAFVAHQQVSYWRTTAKLFARDMTTLGYAHPMLLNLMGFEAFDQGDFLRSIPFYKMTLSIQPNDLDAISNLGIALFAVGRYAEADPWLVKSSKLAKIPRVGVLNARGKIAESQGRINDACDFWRLAISLNPYFGEARINLANALAGKAETDEALEILDTGIRVTPGNDRLQSARADLLEKIRHSDDARKASNRAANPREENTTGPAFPNAGPAKVVVP